MKSFPSKKLPVIPSIVGSEKWINSQKLQRAEWCVQTITRIPSFHVRIVGVYFNVIRERRRKYLYKSHSFLLKRLSWWICTVIHTHVKHFFWLWRHLPHWRRQSQTLILLSTGFLSARQSGLLLDPKCPEGTSRRPKHLSEKSGEIVP